MSKRENKPAFAAMACSANGTRWTQEGMSLRTYYAGQAMMGLLASWGNHDVTAFDEIAHDAVKAADALILELDKTEK